MLTVLALLVACAGTSDDDGKTPVDTGEDFGPNPVVPEDYALLWDIDASSCEDEDAIVYFLFNGTVDADGSFAGEEGWYWFFKEEGWEGDCVDTFSITGEEGELGWETSPCAGCDREFLVEWDLTDETCGGFGYESFFDDDDRDRIDEEHYIGDILLDPLSPSGMVNENMLVFAYTQDDQSEYSYLARPDSRGKYYPEEGSDYETGPASFTWVVSTGICVSFE